MIIGDDCWTAIDDDTYDGAPDSSTRNHIGYGPTEEAAIADLRRLLDERDEWRQAEQDHAEAEEEQSLDYFNRYIAGDR